MNKLVLVLAATTLLSGAAAAQSLGEKTGVNAALGVAPKAGDFVTEAAKSDMLEIEAARIAQQKGGAEEKSFAAQMIADHTRTSAEIKQMVDSGVVKVALPNTLDAPSQAKIDRLKDARTDAFAATYDPLQVSVHEEAVSLFDRYARNGDDPKLKDWAGKTLPALRHHLEMAQQLENKRRGATVGNAPSHETPAPYGAK
jgi:putative membrane protein